MLKLFHGKDTFLSLREVKKEIGQIIGKDKEIALVTIESKETLGEKIINNIVTNDMFSKRKIVLVKRLSENKEKESILEYISKSIKEISDENYYFFWEDSKIASNTKYFKMFKNIVEMGDMNKPSFYKWVSEELNSYKFTSDKETIQILSARVNYKTERLINELEKFSISNVTKLTKEIVIAETTDTLEEDIWALTKAINQSDKKTIFSILEKLFNQSVDTIFIISMIARNIRLYSQVKYLLEKDTPSSLICSQLRIPPFSLPELATNAKNSSWEKVQYIYEKLASLDFEIKRGNIDAQTGLILILNRS